MQIYPLLTRGALRSAAVVAALFSVSACGACKTAKQLPSGQTSAEPDPVGSPTLPTTPLPDAVPQSLAEATPANPLRPEPPPGPTTSNEVGPPSSAPVQLDKLRMPPGFSIELYTPDVPHARSIALGPKGVAFIGTRQDDRVYAVVDNDGDYDVDRVYTIAEGLDTPNGVAYKDGDLYVAEMTRILRYPNIDGRLGNPPRPSVVNEELPDEQAHGWRYIKFGPDGWLYVPVGAPCNNCLREDNPLFASISRMRPDGTGLEVYASGVRNSLGIDWHPQTGELWFTENGRDGLGDDIPPDELNRAPTKGLDFGYPHCHAGVILDPEFGKDDCTEYVQPVQYLGPHVAALGMRFYTGDVFPERYRNAAIIAEHGSWNRSEKIGYRVMAVPIQNNAATAYEPLVDGFLDQATGDVWGRPVDVAVLDDGSMLISDDWQGALYRLSYEG